MQEEFDALGLEYAKRAAQTEECIEVYRRAWADEAVGFQGQFYSFEAVSMDPKPVQRPAPPIIYGGVTVAGARRAARLCDGFYPIFLDSHAEPSRYAKAQEVIRHELERQRKDPAEFAMIGVSSARLTTADDPQARANPRRICTGTPDQILTDLERFAQAGYSLVVCFSSTVRRVSVRNLKTRCSSSASRFCPRRPALSPRAAGKPRCRSRAGSRGRSPVSWTWQSWGRRRRSRTGRPGCAKTPAAITRPWPLPGAA